MREEEIIEASRIGTMKAIRQFTLVFIVVMGVILGGLYTYDWFDKNHTEWEICNLVKERGGCNSNIPCTYFGDKNYYNICMTAKDKTSPSVTSLYVKNKFAISELDEVKG